jgi:hypothetical protein
MRNRLEGGGGQVVQKEKTANGDIAVLGNTSRPRRPQTSLSNADYRLCLACWAQSLI